MFNRSTYDLVFDHPLYMYVCAEPLKLDDLAHRLQVLICSGGPVITLESKNRDIVTRFPNGVLIGDISHQPVGLIAVNYDKTRQFAVSMQDAKLVSISEKIGHFIDILSYENSMELFG
jgi:hypothetical protein